MGARTRRQPKSRRIGARKENNAFWEFAITTTSESGLASPLKTHLCGNTGFTDFGSRISVLSGMANRSQLLGDLARNTARPAASPPRSRLSKIPHRIPHSDTRAEERQALAVSCWSASCTLAGALSSRPSCSSVSHSQQKPEPPSPFTSPPTQPAIPIPTPPHFYLQLTIRRLPRADGSRPLCGNRAHP